jgi:NADPH:quinone reductase-like Zn-dependent oxidoreductase
MHAISSTEYGSPEVLTRTELPNPEPAPAEAFVRAAGAGHVPLPGWPVPADIPDETAPPRCRRA